jgi:hypothetical protein
MERRWRRADHRWLVAATRFGGADDAIPAEE